MDAAFNIQVHHVCALSAFSSAHRSAALLSIGALTALAFAFWWFQLGHYVLLKAAWWVTGELCGCIGFFTVLDNNCRYLTTAIIIQCVVVKRGRALFLFSIDLRMKKGWWWGLNLVWLHPSAHDPLPGPQAGDRLWGCGRADYRPVPLGVGDILPLPLFFYLQDLRWGRWQCMGSGANRR